MAAFPTMLIRRLAVMADMPVETDLKTMLRRAKRRAHPDLGGSTEQMQRVHRIEQLLKDAGERW